MGRPPYVSLHVRASGRRTAASDIVDSVSRELASGRLPAGSRLPPVRVLERQLGLSKNTAQVAYDELYARGLVETREREGVFVAAGAAPAARADAAAIAPPLPRLRPPPPMGRASVPGHGIALGPVFIDPELLPTERIAECVRSVLRQPGMSTFYDAQGHRGLREAIAARLSARGIECTADEVITTTGSQQAL